MNVDSRRLIKHQGKLLNLLRTVREDHNPIIETWKTHLNADTVLRKDDMLFFCEEIIEAEIIDNTKVFQLNLFE